MQGKYLSVIAALLAVTMMLTSCGGEKGEGSSDGSNSQTNSKEESGAVASEVASQGVSNAVSELISSALSSIAESQEQEGQQSGEDSNQNGQGLSQGTNTADDPANQDGDIPKEEPPSGTDQPSGPSVPPPGDYTGSISIRLPSASGSEVYTDGTTYIDASNKSQGYVMVRTDYSGGARLKIQVISSSTYNYDLSPGGWTTLPLQMGSGTYTVRVMENTSGNKYRKLISQDVSVSLNSNLSPYRYPNQYVNYNASSRAVRKSFNLCANASSDLEKVIAIYSYVTGNVAYDYGKANSVSTGYLPSPDATLSSGYGICFDYAALTATMLRAQGIPTKLAIGTIGGLNHAWNYIYIEGSGWIAVEVYFDGYQWNFADTTFAATGELSAESNYTTLRVY